MRCFRTATVNTMSATAAAMPERIPMRRMSRCTAGRFGFRKSNGSPAASLKPKASPMAAMEPGACSRASAGSSRTAARSSNVQGRFNRFSIDSTTAASCPVAPVTAMFATGGFGSMPEKLCKLRTTSMVTESTKLSDFPAPPVTSGDEASALTTAPSVTTAGSECGFTPAPRLKSSVCCVMTSMFISSGRSETSAIACSSSTR